MSMYLISCLAARDQCVFFIASSFLVAFSAVCTLAYPHLMKIVSLSWKRVIVPRTTYGLPCFGRQPMSSGPSKLVIQGSGMLSYLSFAGFVISVSFSNLFVHHPCSFLSNNSGISWRCECHLRHHPNFLYQTKIATLFDIAFFDTRRRTTMNCKTKLRTCSEGVQSEYIFE